MALITELRQLLRKEFPGAQVKLAPFKPNDRVGGSLIWEGFEGQAQIDRQTRLREVIDTLPSDEQLKVSFILTITPEEYSFMATS